MTDNICPECEAKRQIYTIRKRESVRVRGVPVRAYATVKVCSRGHEFETYEDGQATIVAVYIMYEHITGRNIERFTRDQYVLPVKEDLQM